MSYYYVAHPNEDFSATVSAPSTDKARTTFLDYLERTGRASRANRQSIRRHLIAERIDAPEEVEADVNLHYNYLNGGYDEGQPQVAFGGRYEGEEPLEEGEDEGENLSEERQPEEEPESAVSDTPIGRLATGRL